MLRSLFLLMLALCSCWVVWADDSDYYVTSWDYKAQVHSDNSWTVRETIEVNFVQPHHGIFVYRPQMYCDFHEYKGKLATYDYRLEITDVCVADYPFITDEDSSGQENLIIQIGDENVLLTGTQIYQISYNIAYPDDRVDEGDFIYHSLLGDGWPSNIRRFTYEVNMDEPMRQEEVESCIFYSGVWNDLDDPLQVAAHSEVTANGLHGTIENIPGNHAITFRLQLHDGYFQGAPMESPKTPCSWYLVAFLLALWMIRFLKAFQPRRPVKSVEFHAPQGITGAEVGTIIDNSADVIDLVSLIPHFAQQGYLEIEERKGEHMWNKDKVILHRKSQLPAGTPEYQLKFFNVLFASGDTTDISKMGDRHVEIQAALNSLKEEFKGERKLQQSRGRLWAILLMLLALFIAFISDSQVTSIDSTRLAVGVLFMIGQFVLLVLRQHYANLRAFRNSGITSMAAIVLAAIPVAGIIYLCDDPVNNFLPIYVPAICYGLSFIVLYLSDRMYEDTDYRLEVTGKLLGLKEFIETAEKDRLEMLLKDEPMYFYNILPYAIVFNLADKWADRFKNIDMQTPEWYHGNSNSMASNFMGSSIASSLSKSLSSTVSQQVAASSHAPSSSSGGSGGGGGGGGGGAW